MIKEDGKIIECIAPGKIILSGEHAVVYDFPAISCAIDLKTKCRLKYCLNSNKGLTLNLLSLGKQINCPEFNFIRNFLDQEESELQCLKVVSDPNAKHFIFIFNFIFANLHKESHLPFEVIEDSLSSCSIQVEISSDIPHGAGLGSSAAYNVTISACVMKFYEKISSHPISKFKDKLISFSLKGEKHFHSKPSGIDNVTAVTGGMIYFKNISDYEQISSNLLMDYFNLYLIDTKIRRDTKQFIERVSQFKTDFPLIFTNSVESIGDISKHLHKALTESNTASIINKLIPLNQLFLTIIQVSNREIDEIVQKLNMYNIPSKLTGAGGGGFVLAFVPKEQDETFRNVTKDTNFTIKRVNIVTNSYELNC